MFETRMREKEVKRERKRRPKEREFLSIQIDISRNDFTCLKLASNYARIRGVRIMWEKNLFALIHDFRRNQTICKSSSSSYLALI